MSNIDVLKARLTLEQRDLDNNLICKENKSVMLIRSKQNQWNCLSFTSCGKTYSLQISKEKDNFKLKLGIINPAGFIFECSRLCDETVRGEYLPDNKTKSVEGIVSVLTKASIL